MKTKWNILVVFTLLALLAGMNASPVKAEGEVTPTITVGTSMSILWGYPFNIYASAFADPVFIGGLVDFFIDDVAVATCQDVPNEGANFFCKDVSLALVPGEHTLSASFTPADPVSYASASGSDTFTVLAGSYNIWGYVFKDDDNDGTKDDTEFGPEDGWTLNLTTCAGDSIVREDLSVIGPEVSDSYGLFWFRDVPGGQCFRLSEEVQPGWQPTTPTFAEYTLSGDVFPVYFGSYYPVITITPAEALLPGGDVGVPYTPQVFTATGGQGPYMYTLTSYGRLPDGLVLSTGGTLSGTPTLAGDFFINVQAEDANLAKGIKTYNLTIMTDGTFTLTSSSNLAAPGEAVTFTFGASGEAYDSYMNGIVPPYGEVTFQADGTDIAECSGLPVNIEFENYTIGNYPAQCTTSALGLGSHEIQALFTDWSGGFHAATVSLEGGQTVVSTHADLSISKTDSKDPVKPGAQLVYMLTVSNLGPDAAQSVSVVDTLDRYTTYSSVSAPKGWTCRVAPNKVTCVSAGLASGSSAILKITVTVSRNARLGKELVNNAVVSSLTYDPVITNNSVVQKTLVSR